MSDPSETPDPAVDPAVDPDETPADAEASVADEPPAFQNRAARRAKGKGSAQQTPHGAAPRLDGRPVQGPRQWGNRRSG